MGTEQRPAFTINNNIIKGEEKNVSIETQNIGEIILQVFDNNPNHVGQIETETGVETTYAEMKENCVRCAVWMQKQGIGNDDVVVVCTANQPSDYIPVIASFLAGAIYNPWHHEVTLSTARHLMGLTRPKLVFSCPSALDIMKEAAQLENVDAKFVIFEPHSGEVCLGEVLQQATEEEAKAFQPRAFQGPDSLAMIMFSSGTTGLPKGVMYAYKTLNNLVFGMTVTSNFYRNLLWYSSLYWISGTYCLLQATLGTKTRILHANFYPDNTCQVVEKFKVDFFFLPPSLVTHFCKSGVLEKYKLKSLKFFVVGGAKLGRDIIEQVKSSLPHTFFMSGYGMTEAGGILSVQTNQCTMVESVGFVSPNVQIKVVQMTSGRSLGPNQPGEICFKSPSAMLGYYKNPKATAEMIDEQGWYHTGDKGYYMENGEIIIVDRIKEVMKYRGHQIAPSEIEEYLMSREDVLEAAVVPVPHKLDLELPMAFIKKVPAAKVTEEELIQFSADLGDIKKLRGGVKFLDEMPYTASGKINRRVLKDMAKAYAC